MRTGASLSSLVLASSNKGKLAELQSLLQPVGFDLKLQTDFNIADADETGLSFIENAILKARHAASHSGLPALADDSGLEVDALNGAPGIYSARFAARANAGSGDSDNNRLLLEKLSAVADENRGARFRCVLALVRHADDPSPLIAEGSWNGRILHAPTGENGFGYDPLFFADDAGCSAAQLEKQQKAQNSHRGRALKVLLQRLGEL